MNSGSALKNEISESLPLPPCKDTEKKRAVYYQEVGPHQTLKLPVPGYWIPRLQNCEKSISGVYKPPSLWYSTRAAWTDQDRSPHQVTILYLVSSPLFSYLPVVPVQRTHMPILPQQYRTGVFGMSQLWNSNFCPVSLNVFWGWDLFTWESFPCTPKRAVCQPGYGSVLLHNQRMGREAERSS